MSEPTAPIFEDDAAGSTQSVGERVDDGRGRIFPCEQCGADLEFSIGQQSLQCPYCGHVKELAPTAEAITENDYQTMLIRLKEFRRDDAEQQATLGDHEVRCNSCGANVVFSGTLTSTTCPYCAAPLQRDQVHNAESRIPVDAVLPFLVPRERAAANLRDWVRTRWFAPNDFKRDGANGKFNGCYLPYFTFDSATFTRYEGQRGDHYWVTVTHGKETRQERRTSWSSASGAFDRFFDDILAVAVKDEHGALLEALEPWPLGKCVPFTPEVLAGLFARTYDIPLETAFTAAKARIDAALHADICRRIGGDEQRVSSQKTAYNAVTFKHILLPVWLLAYRYKGTPYRVSINAATGEVNGERPYSWVKITLFVLLCATIALVLFGLMQR